MSCWPGEEGSIPKLVCYFSSLVHNGIGNVDRLVLHVECTFIIGELHEIFYGGVGIFYGVVWLVGCSLGHLLPSREFVGQQLSVVILKLG